MNRVISFILVCFVGLFSLFSQVPVQASPILSGSLLPYCSTGSLVPVIVELSEPAILDHSIILQSDYYCHPAFPDKKVDIDAWQAKLADTQQRWLHILQQKPISFFYRSSCQYIGNFVSLYVKGTDIITLTKQHSVKSVLLDWEEYPIRKIMSVSTGAIKVWNGSNNKSTGKGIKIGIIDSGINHDHPEFENKIVKGVDFTTDENYREDGTGHGTHVAGIAAGLGSSQFGKGMAYDASLYVYKVFPKVGGASTAGNVFQALDMSVSDKCQIVNLSLGHGGDPRAKDGNIYYSIIQKLIKANIFVVAGAGNSGARGKEMAWPVITPGVVEDSFCVAASNDRKYNQTLNSENHRFSYYPINDLAMGNHLQFQTADLYDAAFGNKDDYEDPDSNDKILLIARGPEEFPLSFTEKYSIALSHNPKAIIFSAPCSVSRDYLPELREAIDSSKANIPVLMMQQSDADTLKNESDKTASCFYYADDGLGIADFSSMGPSSDGVFKPDISAPGVDIASTFPRKQYAVSSGTSMATPSISGLVALIKEAKPDWKMDQIKSSLMNNADLIINQINQEPITFTLQGAGQARVDKAIDTEAFLTPRAFIVEKNDSFSQDISIQNAKSTEINISSIKAEIYGLANNDIIQVQVPSKQIKLKSSESGKVTVQFTIRRNLFRRSKYEGNIWINQMHIPFIIYKDTTEIENQTAVKNPISDLQIEKFDLFSCDTKTTNRVEFAFNTGSEQKFEGEIQYSNFGTIRLYLCDLQGLEWVSKPIIEFKQCPVGCYAYEWAYQDYFQENSVPDGTYRLKIISSASQSFELLSDPIKVYDSPELTLGNLFLGIPRYQPPESRIKLHLSAIMADNFEEIEYTLYYDDSRISIENVILDPSIKIEEPPVMKSNYVKIVIPSTNLPINQRFSIATIQAVTSKKIGNAPFSHKILVKTSGQKQKIRIHGFIPELIITKKGDLNCDINLDGITDKTDFFAFSKKLGLDYSQPGYEVIYDFNQDKIIDMLDYEVLLMELSS